MGMGTLGGWGVGVKADVSKELLLESTVPGGGSPGDDFGDEDAWVITNVGVVTATSNAEAQT